MHRITFTLGAALVFAALAFAAPAQGYQHLQNCIDSLEGRVGDNDLARWVSERTPTGVTGFGPANGHVRHNYGNQPQMSVQYPAYRANGSWWGNVNGYCVGHDGSIVDHMGRVPSSWLGVVPDPVRLLMSVARNERPAARVLETTAQFDVAKERVVREARKLQRENRYRDGSRRVTPRASWWLQGTTENGPTVTLRWRITVRTKPQAGTAGSLVCKGRVTVRGEPTTDPNALRAALATDTCVA